MEVHDTAAGDDDGAAFEAAVCRMEQIGAVHRSWRSTRFNGRPLSADCSEDSPMAGYAAQFLGATIGELEA
jgi:hypothetical protein